MAGLLGPWTPGKLAWSGRLTTLLSSGEILWPNHDIWKDSAYNGDGSIHVNTKYLQGGAPYLAKLVWNLFNYGLWWILL